jgi:hypothetical protein
MREAMEERQATVDRVQPASVSLLVTTVQNLIQNARDPIILETCYIFAVGESLQASFMDYLGG